MPKRTVRATDSPPAPAKRATPAGRAWWRSRLLPLTALALGVVAGIATSQRPTRLAFPEASGAVTITAASSGARARLRAGAGADGGTAPTAEDPTLHTLELLRQRYGDPPQANAGRIRIPSINIDAPISHQVVASDGILQDPIGPSDVAWYDFAGLIGVGGAPGGGGNAVFAAHVDRAGHLDYAGVDYNGPGIFFWLDRLQSGDVIEVTMRGRTLRYEVTWAREVSASDRDEWEDVVTADVGGDSITLVTCGGDFDRATQEYASRLVVRATRG